MLKALLGGEKFLVGVAFQQEEVRFSIRMVDQFYHIEDYRSQAKKTKI